MANATELQECFTSLCWTLSWSSPSKPSTDIL